MAVPDDKRELFTEQMMKVFYYGGMMSFDDVKLYGHEISLLCPVKRRMERKCVSITITFRTMPGRRWSMMKREIVCGQERSAVMNFSM